MDGEDLQRIEREYTDPTALTEGTIQAALAEQGIDGNSLDAAAEGIAERRAEVRADAEELLDNRLETRTSTTMIRRDDGSFATAAANVVGDLDIAGDGTVSVPVEGGGSVTLGSLDLPQGSR
jgi:hypothetical protein